MKQTVLILIVAFTLIQCKKSDVVKNEALQTVNASDWRLLATVDNKLKNINDFCFSDTKTLWIVGEYNFVVKSTDGGINFQRVEIDPNYLAFEPWNTIYFQSQMVGWIAGKNNLYKTSDGGITWAKISLSSVGQLYGITSIYFISNEIGFITSGYGVLLRTIDGGKTWVNQYNPLMKDYIYYTIIFSDKDHGWVTGSLGALLGTVDGGANWTILQHAPDTNPLSFARAQKLNIIAINNLELISPGPKLLKSMDGGKTWVASEGDLDGDYLYMKNKDEGFCAFKNTYSNNVINLAYTKNQGKTWTKLSVGNPIGQNIIKILPVEGSLFAVTIYGQILKYDK